PATTSQPSSLSYLGAIVRQAAALSWGLQPNPHPPEKAHSLSPVNHPTGWQPVVPRRHRTTSCQLVVGSNPKPTHARKPTRSHPSTTRQAGSLSYLGAIVRQAASLSGGSNPKPTHARKLPRSRPLATRPRPQRHTL